jgi:hypothetical protein
MLCPIVLCHSCASPLEHMLLCAVRLEHVLHITRVAISCAGRESLPSGKYQHMYTMSGRSFSIVRYNSLYPITPVVARTAKPL